MDAPPLPPGMDADYFNRLPQSVREETLAKWQAEARRMESYKRRLRNRALKAALIGGTFLGLYSLLLPGGANIAVIFIVGGIAAGLSIVQFRLCVLMGTIVFGGTHIFLTCVCAGLKTGNQSFFGGWMTGTTYLFVFSTWIFSCAAGVLMSRSAEACRITEDCF
jgi:hypothetical protein